MGSNVAWVGLDRYGYCKRNWLTGWSIDVTESFILFFSLPRYTGIIVEVSCSARIIERGVQTRLIQGEC